MGGLFSKKSDGSPGLIQSAFTPKADPIPALTDAAVKKTNQASSMAPRTASVFGGSLLGSQAQTIRKTLLGQ